VNASSPTSANDMPVSNEALGRILWLGMSEWFLSSRCCATNRKVAGSILDGVIGISH